MPILGQRKACKWLVGLVLLALHGLIASPISLAQTPCDGRPGCMECKEDPDFVIDCEKEEGSKCQLKDSKCLIQDKPEVSVTITVDITLVDCGIDLLPPLLSASGKNDHKVVQHHCALVDDQGTLFWVSVADVDRDTIRLNLCDKWPDCLEDPAQFNLFQDKGLSPKQTSLQRFDRDVVWLDLRYDERALFDLVCPTSVRTVAVLAQLVNDAKAVAKDGSTVDVGGAYTRGMDRVVCLSRDVRK